MPCVTPPGKGDENPPRSSLLGLRCSHCSFCQPACCGSLLTCLLLLKCTYFGGHRLYLHLLPPISHPPPTDLGFLGHFLTWAALSWLGQLCWERYPSLASRPMPRGRNKWGWRRSLGELEWKAQGRR